MEEIYVEYQADIKNYFEAAEYYRKNKMKKNIFDRIMEIFVVLIGIYMLTIGNFILGIIFVVFGVLLLLRILEKAVTYLYFKMYIAKRGTQKLFISNEKMRYVLKDIKSDVDWNYYKDFIETPNTVLLLYGKKQYSVIPKKAFDNTELGNFILLLKNKFQNKKK